MKRRRILAVEGAAYYHCMSRVVAGERYLESSRAKEVLRKMIWEVAAFCGVRVLTYAVMSNHFHVLVAVPPKAEVSDAELLGRYRRLYGIWRSAHAPAPERLEALLAEGGPAAEDWRRRLTRRMADVSEYMKTLKQRFSVWYNREHGRFGTLWADRFKSVLVEGSSRALSTVAAYIDLNPVRAGLVRRPSDYAWSGVGEAARGIRRAQEGVKQALGKALSSRGEAVEEYRSRVLSEDEMSHDVSGETGSTAPAAGPPSRSRALRSRVRYFSSGAVIGSPAFIESWIEAQPELPRRRRRPRANPMRGAVWKGLATLRGLRKAVIQPGQGAA